MTRPSIALAHLWSNADGSPAVRLMYLIGELEKRFPDPNPYSARVPEVRYLAAIDKLIGKFEDKLVHDVILERWEDVARVLREYKKKKHSQFYLEVHELQDRYTVKVYRRGA
jgi:hypothetical protein